MQAVIDYCAQIGQDPLLVQGAGGNVSWKEGEALCIKASGAWLADALDRNIFCAVDLPHLRQALRDGDFAVTPRPLGSGDLKPSIETALHALMPHRVVVHLHAVEILAHLVRADWRANLSQRVGQAVAWTAVDYFKPGAALAQAVSEALAQQPGTDVVFLGNHGVVIGGDDVAEIAQRLQILTQALATPASFESFAPVATSGLAPYQLLPDAALQGLALDERLFARLARDWALYPDHVVFLGAQAHVYPSRQAWEQAQPGADEERLALVFVRGEGVFVAKELNQARLQQLRCYFDVLVRQTPDQELVPLTGLQIAELLNWDAEQYRMRFAK
jgi:rhamnose utilization protein RhaD (predicted bifunctional aldolase and dehydrogenase)